MLKTLIILKTIILLIFVSANGFAQKQNTSIVYTQVVKDNLNCGWNSNTKRIFCFVMVRTTDANVYNSAENQTRKISIPPQEFPLDLEVLYGDNKVALSSNGNPLDNNLPAKLSKEMNLANNNSLTFEIDSTYMSKIFGAHYMQDLREQHMNFESKDRPTALDLTDYLKGATRQNTTDESLIAKVESSSVHFSSYSCHFNNTKGNRRAECSWKITMTFVIGSASADSVKNPYTEATSAGCLVKTDDGVKVFRGQRQEDFEPTLQLPGTLRKKGQSAQEAAQKATYEELGVDVLVGDVIAKFKPFTLSQQNYGWFYLFACELKDKNQSFTPKDTYESQEVLSINQSNFANYPKEQWKYPENFEIIQKIINP